MRRILAAASLLCLALSGAQPAMAQDAPAPAVPEPGLELLYRSLVRLEPATDVGDTARGHRRFIPIVGGTFEGPRMRGEILPMGWDWQLDRADGCTELVADYFLRTDDGVVINVVNTGVICRQGADGTPPPPIRTSPVFEAPLGQYQWLGQGAYVGTLGFDPTVTGPHVVITIYRSN